MWQVWDNERLQNEPELEMLQKMFETYISYGLDPEESGKHALAAMAWLPLRSKQEEISEEQQRVQRSVWNCSHSRRKEMDKWVRESVSRTDTLDQKIGEVQKQVDEVNQLLASLGDKMRETADALDRNNNSTEYLGDKYKEIDDKIWYLEWQRDYDRWKMEHPNEDLGNGEYVQPNY